ncbi:T6SS immunity protein Tli4 family protein [Moellerella wisconsensis]|uniref:T6SS immunity protein Tli4 family protein n=1 Tax=Moellerella wisconsensis TaxID=158849 RepID=A0ACD3Y505_9GAMM|nr:T6SS immunity protein Tli4 family protein [Moellerella wisconsensis]UNH23504.1 T6SS immunity protein Tli4 family protein [Moellerella wisconsensis]UNH26587.1 T6SS immunity protein Tli4 family protein [Moellerella wisconsensis]UNH38222.1 T6SS immunity protein Tli4 family protein [Moellerella wisconsensis]UNH41730.1 T6SS immunity protein Tli4 family protein [Moellerella wisconsensis]WJW81238.1 T6SS immunity protein Tli4 family protein [Moellerella wisconsensis]
MGNKKTTYSDTQIVEIWDRIISSFRYKPNTF